MPSASVNDTFQLVCVLIAIDGVESGSWCFPASRGLMGLFSLNKNPAPEHMASIPGSCSLMCWVL